MDAIQGKEQMLGLVVAAAIGGFGLGMLLSSGGKGKKDGTSEYDEMVVKTVKDFLHSQSLRDLDLMCSLVTEDVVYINEPFPPERYIIGRSAFREVFSTSPCIYGEDANLQLLQLVHEPGSDTVFVERHDQFLVDGKWIRIPILGYLKVKNGKVCFWKDYWDYQKYKQYVTKEFGPDFKLFRTQPKKA